MQYQTSTILTQAQKSLHQAGRQCARVTVFQFRLDAIGAPRRVVPERDRKHVVVTRRETALYGFKIDLNAITHLHHGSRRFRRRSSRDVEREARRRLGLAARTLSRGDEVSNRDLRRHGEPIALVPHQSAE